MMMQSNSSPIEAVFANVRCLKRRTPQGFVTAASISNASEGIKGFVTAASICNASEGIAILSS